MTDTIAAIATPPGRGGVGIVRISGPQAEHVMQHIVGKPLSPRHAHYGPFYATDNSVLDQGIALYFPGPHSFTGEDIIELQGHGGPAILDCLLQTVLSLPGVRMARPGEFSERAFVNDKMDLTQAEAVADLINASSEQAARCAVRSLQGVFSKQVDDLLEQLIYLRTYVEAAIDFPEEEIDFLSDGKVADLLTAVMTQTDQLLSAAKQGQILQHGMTIVIAGKPNAGKSSLLNALAGRESAIVTDVAGTTRDILREDIAIEGVPLHIVDTAGLRETNDVVEQEGVRRAKAVMQEADRILLVVDLADLSDVGTLQASLLQDLPSIPVTIVLNKVDQHPEVKKITEVNDDPVVLVSAKQGDGLETLRQHLLKIVGFDQTLEGGFIARRRHVNAIGQVQYALSNGQKQLQVYQAGELLAEDLRVAQDALSEITGRFSSDDLLGEIFGSFCIGK